MKSADYRRRRPMAVYAITKHGLKHAMRLVDAFPGADLYVSGKHLANAPAQARELSLPMAPTLRDTFAAYDCHVFVISVGAVVRMIAPLLTNKKVDPAVVCIDDSARYSICVLSGHVGGGNELTLALADAIGATPVITTASDVLGTLTVDILGRELGFSLEDMDRNVTRGCAAVVNGEKVLIVHEAGEPTFWPLDRKLPAGVSYTSSLQGVQPDDWSILLVISDRDIRASHPAHWQNSIVYRPRSLCIGIGCDRGTPASVIATGVDKVLSEHKLAAASVRTLATIDVKGDEPGLRQFAEERGWPLCTYSAEQLDRVPGIETPSDVVKRHVGTRAVAEPAALLAAGAARLLVAKQKHRDVQSGKNMTAAFARIPFAKRPKEAFHGSHE